MDSINFSAAERVDLADLNYVAQDTPLGFVREMAAYFALNPSATQKAFVINGFKATNPTGNQIQVALGSAFLGRRVGLDISYGLMTATGEATQAIDVSSFQAGTYGVYVKFDQTPGAQENRTFWQAGETSGEYASSVPTKLLSTWQMTIVALNPGAEWLQVATLQLPGNTLTDTRPLYFEGRPDQAFDSGWGTGTNDRNTDRATYGIGDLQTFTAAMRTAIEDVKGPGLTRWWENKIGGQNIGFSGTPTLGRTAWSDTNFFAQGSATAPSISFDTSTALIYNRASQTFAFAPNAQTTLLISPTAATAPLSLVVGTANQLTFKATSTTASALFAPGSTSTLFEQRATNASLPTLATYAGGTLAGSVDSNRNWLLGAASTGYAYPTSGTATSYAALTVADTSGNTLMRLDTSGASGVPATMTLRANTAATQVRFTPNATATSSTYSYAIGASGTVFGLYTANASILTFDSSVGNAAFAVNVTAPSYAYSSAQTYIYHPSIYDFVGQGGILLGSSSNSLAGGGLVYTGGNGPVYWPLAIPDGSTLVSVTLNATRLHGGSSTASNNVTISVAANQAGLNNAIYGGATLGINTYAPGWQPQGTAAGSIQQYNMAVTGMSASISNQGGYRNVLLAFTDTDSAVTTTIFGINVTLTRTVVTSNLI